MGRGGSAVGPTIAEQITDLWSFLLHKPWIMWTVIWCQFKKENTMFMPGHFTKFNLSLQQAGCEVKVQCKDMFLASISCCGEQDLWMNLKNVRMRQILPPWLSLIHLEMGGNPNSPLHLCQAQLLLRSASAVHSVASLTHKALLLAVPKRSGSHPISHQGQERLFNLGQETETRLTGAVFCASPHSLSP